MRKFKKSIVFTFVLVMLLLTCAAFFFLRSNQYSELRLLERSRANIAMFTELSQGQLIKEHYKISQQCRHGRGFHVYAIPRTDIDSLCQQLKDVLERNGYDIDKSCKKTSFIQNNDIELVATKELSHTVLGMSLKQKSVVDIKMPNMHGETFDDYSSNLAFINIFSKDKVFWQDKTPVAIYSKIYLDRQYYNDFYANKHRGKCSYVNHDMVNGIITQSVS
ncbi:hypothetical protein [Moraxella bovis]|uniref:Uncharacterized protein n=2 Tax=Moraxella bovis TaxID=476 RepID=A0A378PR30_MORBO|nr:hypothetical protein [Moraxella bovis]STY90413.1 Uncharacterised protein [Moraxella bovis]